MSPNSISPKSNHSLLTTQGPWQRGATAKADDPASGKSLPRIAQQRAGASQTTGACAGAFKARGKPDNTSSTSVWVQKDAAAKALMGVRTAQKAAVSSRQDSGTDPGPANVAALASVRRTTAESGAAVVVAKKETGTNSHATNQAPRKKVKLAQVLKLGAVAASFPARVAFGAFYLPVIALTQAGMSIAKAIKGDKTVGMANWKTPEKGQAGKDVKGFDDQSMILKSDEKEFKAMDRQVAVVSHAHKIDKDRIAEFSDADARPQDKPGRGPLSAMTLNSRLDIVADDVIDGKSRRSPEDIANILSAKGLRHVGVINVDSTLAESKTFLVELGNALAKKGVDFGWIANSHGIATDTRQVGKLGAKTYTWSMIALPWKRMTARMTPASLDRSVVQGNAAVNFAKTPYHADKPTIASKYFQA